MQFIDLKSQYKKNKKNIDNRIKGVLEHGKYIYGPEVFELEEKLSEYVGVKHTITCANGTDALTLSLMALGIKEGDAIFCPTFTFFATAEVISLIGATPIFVDCNKDTFNMCPTDLEEKISITLKKGKSRPKAIMTVDLFGLSSNYPMIQDIASKFNLKVIEDSAQGFGGEINGKKNCSFGDIATTSFFPAKPLGCYGDGGAIFTDSDELSEIIRSLAVHGKGKDKYDNVRIGLNSRLDTIQAAILLEKLAIFPSELIARNEVAQKYKKIYDGIFATPNVPDGYLSSWAQYTVISEDRDSAMKSLNSNGIPTMIYYPKPLHLQTAFKYLDHKVGDFPVSEYLSGHVFSLPMHPYLELID